MQAVVKEQGQRSKHITSYIKQDGLTHFPRIAAAQKQQEDAWRRALCCIGARVVP